MDKNKYNPLIHHRRSLRLQGYDYSRAGFYFVTICCQDRKCVFGDVENGEMILNECGRIASDFLKNASGKYDRIQMHEFVVMPNHVHAIIEITADNAGMIHESSLPQDESSLPPEPTTVLLYRDQRRKMLLSKIVGWYKMNTSKQINIIRNMTGSPLWQRNYHERILRDQKSFIRVSNYIRNNPRKWNVDQFY